MGANKVSNFTKGLNVIIGENVQIGENVHIGNNVIIYDGAQIGNNVMIQDNVVIGKQPARAKNSILPEVKKLPPTVIGNGVTIGTSSIIYANAQLADDVFVADLATIRERVTIGEKTIVGRGVAVENDCQVGSYCKLETNCYITAYSTLEDNVFIAPCVVTTNDNFMARSKERYEQFKGVTVKQGGRIGANATILPGKTIEEDGAVAAGSVVTKDVDRESIVAGVPAKSLKKVPESQLLKNQ
jgi:acetyltransferase-like isoleucine patch superfamily enzyme